MILWDACDIFANIRNSFFCQKALAIIYITINKTFCVVRGVYVILPPKIASKSANQQEECFAQFGYLWSFHWAYLIAGEWTTVSVEFPYWSSYLSLWPENVMVIFHFQNQGSTVIVFPPNWSHHICEKFSNASSCCTIIFALKSFHPPPICSLWYIHLTLYPLYIYDSSMRLALASN